MEPYSGFNKTLNLGNLLRYFFKRNDLIFQIIVITYFKIATSFSTVESQISGCSVKIANRSLYLY